MPFTGNYTCDSFKSGLMSGTFNFSLLTTDVYKIALYTNNADLNNQTQNYSSLNEVVATGYTPGGQIITPNIGFNDGVSFINFSNVSWNGSISARGALIYKFDNSLNPAICVLDFGSDKMSSNTFYVTFPPSTYTSAIIRIE